MKLNESEVVIALREAANLEELQASMLALQYWLGQKVPLTCRIASAEEVSQATKAVAELERNSSAGDQDARFLKMISIS